MYDASKISLLLQKFNEGGVIIMPVTPCQRFVLVFLAEFDSKVENNIELTSPEFSEKWTRRPRPVKTQARRASSQANFKK
jgi:hypothetical protein